MYPKVVPAPLQAGARRGPDVLLTAVPGSLLLQAQIGTPCGFSRSESDTPPRRKPRWGGKLFSPTSCRKCSLVTLILIETRGRTRRTVFRPSWMRRLGQLFFGSVPRKPPRAGWNP
ncbi:unnamed protein product [Arctia plantaginis]|uniref:Uncharacterized protein n=1 Tax=Arctia plantaginis TaxID=874455 RepID=A0A8S0ZXL3_ARCPL|nr:unnamed protein product [Arctia plantaginis]